ncbi:hypothetical protein RHMOL_Rhmol01G0197400 [Rhododendron molle]|uniref:Uncharacterized protein n=1 Tax=Rhododendron molle TaxID=49168 RepID=A0ACC0Q3M0_RHOML|nr:hypothetical protein RHMOL_Rhmol01G0197400 [Rhododendron molle]
MSCFHIVIPGFLNGLCVLYQCSAFEVDSNETAWLFVNASEAFGQTIPETLCGIFFERARFSKISLCLSPSFL